MRKQEQHSSIACVSGGKRGKKGRAPARSRPPPRGKMQHSFFMGRSWHWVFSEVLTRYKRPSGYNQRFLIWGDQSGGLVQGTTILIQQRWFCRAAPWMSVWLTGSGRGGRGENLISLQHSLYFLAKNPVTAVIFFTLPA